MPIPKHLHLELLKLLQKSKSKKDLLKKCPNSVIKAVCECALNVLKGTVPISSHQKRKLSPYKQTLRQLAKKKVPLFKKRKLLVQKGEGFLSFILPAAISLLGSLFNGAR
ncbi:iron-uptake system-binding protein [Lasius niger]|uniref:Iron-uptake system-binding protein n=1 Tax=Lasius niger TaxID=67767 RepID=A0A0J7JTV7_LASNI|nr:iron-uptake system-binding protein [Lasius niger]